MPHNDIYTVKNPLRRSGTSQLQRHLAVLDPNSVKIDGRTIEDFLVYASEFARQIYYYNKSNVIEGDWQEFFAYDISVIIATIEKINPQKNKETFQQLLNANTSVEGLYLLFENILGLVSKLDDAYLNLPPENEFRDQISRLIRSNLQNFLSTLWGWEMGAEKVFGDEGFTPTNPNTYISLSSVWGLGEIVDIKVDANLFKPLWQPVSDSELPPNPTVEEKLEIAYKKLNKQFTDLYNVYFQVIKLAATNFKKSLTLDNHQPHIALFTGFLYLYQLVQEDLNKITGKHLNFYYKDVLKLKLKPSIPDKVHLYFELAKHVEEHKLAKGIRFLAGKDETGADVYYEADGDTVLNKAQVESISTLFVERQKKDDGTLDFKNIYAAPVANSQDGLGAEIDDEEKPSWMTFGSKAMPKAVIGFAIASNELLLAEGTRKITLTINYTGANISDTSNLKVAFSGEKGWIEPATFPSITPTSNKLTVEITLNPEEPAVIPFDEKAMKQSLGTTLPVLKLYVHQPESATANATLKQLKDIKITSFDLDIDVKGLESLLAFNDLSVLNTQKSFVPFGVTPVLGSSFYVGSKEVFQKQLSKVNLNITWENLPKNAGGNLDFKNYYVGYDNAPAGNNDFSIKASILKSKGESVLLNSKEIFGTPVKDKDDKIIPDSYSIEIVNNSLAAAILSSELDGYGSNPDFGFLKFDLLRNFNHKDFPNVLSRQLIAASKTSGQYLVGAYYKDKNDVIFKLDLAVPDSTKNPPPYEVVMPNEPYTPTVKAITIDYHSKLTIGESAIENSMFIHLHPFENTYKQYAVVNNVKLLPQLHNYSTQTETFNLEGALLIGLKDLKPKQSLSLLFQVAENSADADADVAKVKWQYLADNAWTNFKEYEITKETTNGFLTSGIVTFAIPDKINRNNTILSNQLHWIRAWVEKDSVAVSEMINIHAQAVQLNFQDNGNDPAFLATPLPVGTIAKLEIDDTAINSINQDYESFGGRQPEQPEQYYTRVSERLRHKGRAVTIYDYERLVLEQFNDIYKVKCINHTNDDNKLAPGHVQVAVIPDFTKLKAVDRRQPKVTKAKLEEIRDFLEDRSTTFVDTFKNNAQEKKYLHVLNPIYRKIRVTFAVKFNEDITAIEFYKRELRQAIIRFLSPWAFEDGAELNFGGKVFKSSIQGFVEKQEYVDYVMVFKLMDDVHNVDVNFIEADTARTILVPDEENYFEIFDAANCLAENTLTGDSLGYTTIIKDFIVK